MDAYAVAVIELLGGTSKTAEFFDIQPPSVSEWKEAGIPKARLQTLQHAKPELLAAAAKACEPSHA